MEEVELVPTEEVQEEKKEEIKEGKAAKKWSMFFFVMSALGLMVVAGSIALPIVIMLFGVISALCWVLFVLFISVFTLGMIWLNEGVKTFNRAWMDFNDMLFHAGDTIYQKALVTVPYLVIGASVFFIGAWIFMIAGIIKDKNRKKYYTGMLIALGIITLLFIISTIVTLIAYKNR